MFNKYFNISFYLIFKNNSVSLEKCYCIFDKFNNLKNLKEKILKMYVFVLKIFEKKIVVICDKLNFYY